MTQAHESFILQLTTARQYITNNLTKVNRFASSEIKIEVHNDSLRLTLLFFTIWPLILASAVCSHMNAWATFVIVPKSHFQSIRKTKAKGIEWETQEKAMPRIFLYVFLSACHISIMIWVLVLYNYLNFLSPCFTTDFLCFEALLLLNVRAAAAEMIQASENNVFILVFKRSHSS